MRHGQMRFLIPTVVAALGLGGCGEVNVEPDAGCVPSECESGVCDDTSCATSRMEPCRDEAPDNATSDVVDVVTTFTSGEGWSEPAACEWTCDPGFGRVEDSDTCADELLVPCIDVAPTNATSFPADVVITYSDANGWTEPAGCEWDCNVDYCRNGEVCEYAYQEIRFDQGDGASWFGGDDREGVGPRNVGAGQRVRPPMDIVMDHFAFHFTAPFESAQNPAGGVAVTLRLDLRNASGAILKTVTAPVPATFDGGWIWWDIGYPLTAETDYIFTAFMMNGYTLGLTSYISADTDNGYPDGIRFSAEGGDDLSNWTEWGGDFSDTWDYRFWIRTAPACEQP